MVNNIQLDNTSVINGDSNIKNNKTNGEFSTILSETTKANQSQTTTLDSIFEKASKKYNLPVNLLKAVAKAESNFDPKAVSKSGAQGVMQLMPQTAKYLGVTNSFDPEQNIMGGSKYLAELYNKYNGDIKLTLAAYNAGMGNVAKYGGIPPFKETQNYVVKVIKFMDEDITAPNTVINNTNKTQTQVNANTQNYQIEQYDSTDDDSIYSYDDYLKLLSILKEQMQLFHLEKSTDMINRLLTKM